ncbi:hypothetical protein GCM10011609_35330 [Lentzea pudingi]|uniref:Extradiol ring-cleavage dioxygenase LigAB LigA subunit domain-containing protein n=1 Tax=Lentzea pudingi TaxID=1789439 RepID=A0ABQ2HYV4_9PSEU|nr:hypothetical protein [Lentzea pudingi]GGM94808.1 hypothetical protein GCM10011609_35330 [Lentzea pudingi]
MSRYEVDKALWDVYRDASAAKQYRRDPVGFLAPRDLSDEEREALAARDVRRLVALGSHPFLTYNFALRLAGGFSMPFVQDYVGQLQGLVVGDITT